jgi:ssDNA-binding Zn-finger/Zn-ribbon topoisomerase 1
MDETRVRLLCPECGKNWQSQPEELPESSGMYHCPNCHASRGMSEFMRTEHDLRTLQQLG